MFRSNKTMFFLVFLFVVSFLFADNYLNFEVNTKSKAQTEIEFKVPAYQIKTITEAGREFKSIEIDNQNFTTTEGFPELPVFTTTIAIPIDSNIQMEIMDVRSQKIISNTCIKPRQSLSGEGSFIRNDAFYSSQKSFPENLVDVSETMTVRDFQIVNINVYPFQYNSGKNELQVNEDIRIVIKHQSRNGNGDYYLNRHISQAFEPIYKALIANYDQIRDPQFTYQKPSLLIIHPNDTSITSTITTLVNWKKQMGFEVNTASTTQTGISTSSIKQYILNQYNTSENPPEYVLLIGDTQGSLVIPTFILTYHQNEGAGDYPYTHLAGNDLIGDIMIGRLSVDGAPTLSLMVSKIQFYDKVPTQGGSDWMNKNLLVGDSEPSGYSCISTNQYIRDIIHQYDPDQQFNELYGAQLNPGSIVNAASQGALTFNYRGYYNMNGFDNSDINALNNIKKMFTAVWLTCNTGDYSDVEISRIEKVTRLGTNANPKGAITAIGMSTSRTLVAYNNLLASAIYEGMYNQGMTNMGQALLYAKINLVRVYKNTNGVADDLAHWCNLIGDPSLNIYKDIPKILNVTYPETIYNSQNSVLVRVTDQNQVPISYAKVSITSNNNLFFNATTDDNGYAQIYFTQPVSGSLQLVASNADYQAFIGTINTDTNGFVEINNYDIVDQVNGNNNQLINPNENITLNTIFKNNSSQTLSNIQICLQSDSPYINITDSLKTINSLTANTIASALPFSFTVKPNCPDNYVLNLRFRIVCNNITSWSNLSINTKGVDLSYEGYSLSSSGSIFTNGVDTGFFVNLRNTGSIFYSEITAKLICNSQLLTIIDSTGTYANSTLNAVVSNSQDLFNVRLSSTTPPNSQIPVQLVLFNNNQEIDRVSFSLFTRASVNGDPLGPDNYGYLIFDQSDLNYPQCPNYNWIEIGSIGTNLNIYDNASNDDAVGGINLPFTFRYYGQVYDHITISTNGWFVFGTTEQTGMRNLPLPGTGAPYRIVAPFWGDLIVPDYGISGIYTYYDQINHYFVIEWRNAKNYYCYNNFSQESDYINFQAILYDSQFYQDYSIDGAMKFQYKDFNEGFLGVDEYPSNYFTTGFQNQNATDGLTYAYKNIYSSACQTLQNQSSLLITSSNNINNNSTLFTVPSLISINEDNNYNLELSQYIAGFSPENANEYSLGIIQHEHLNATISNFHLSLTPEPNWSGFTSLIIALVHNNSQTTYRRITFNIHPINDPPSIINQIPQITFNDNNTYTGLNLSSYINDPDVNFNDHLTFTATPIDSIAVTFNGNQVILTPAHNFSGVRNVTFTAQDDSLCQVNLSIQINVIDVNEAPVINFPALISGVEDHPLQINLQTYISDIDNDFNEISIQAYNSAHSTTNISGNILTITPTLNYSGYDHIFISVSDLADNLNLKSDMGLVSRLTTVDTLMVKFISSNDLPVINSFLPDSLSFSVAVDVPVSFNVSASDVDNSSLMYYWFVNNIYQSITSNSMTRSFITPGSYEVKCKVMDTSSSVYNTWNVNITSTPNEDLTVKNTALQNNFPNPFNPETKISYQLKSEGETSLIIYNTKGQIVKTLVKQRMGQGKHSVIWNGTDKYGKHVSSGIYFYELRTKDYSNIKKMILIK